MSAYKLIFTGSFETLSNKLHANIHDIDIKRLDDTSAISKCENFEELHYFQGIDLGDGTKITDIQEHISNTIIEKLNEPTIEKSVLLTTPDFVGNADEKSEDPKANLDNAVLNSVLNSKSPLPEEDPFKYVQNKNFLILSTLSASVLLFVASLF